MWDVLVVGAGPAGCASALALQKRGARVLVLERSAERRPHPGESLVGEGLVCLEELGALDAFRALEARPCFLHRVHWAGKSAELSSWQRRGGHSHQLDRVAFDTMLQNECKRRGVTVKLGSKLTELALEGTGIHAQLSGDTHEALSARFVIDATGRSTWVCRRLGARRQRADRLVAWAATFYRGTCEPSSLIESGPEGWWYSAPRPGGLMTAMYISELLASPAPDPEALWFGAMADAPLTHQRLSGQTRCSDFQAYRAGPEWTEIDASAPVLPVGDAALSFDPMAGDGLCFALRSGLEAARAIDSLVLRRAYVEGACGIYESHLREREAAYAAERSLRRSPFWKQRRDGCGSPNRPVRLLPANISVPSESWPNVAATDLPPPNLA
jgi:flavin-dependent dehydrogenase